MSKIFLMPSDLPKGLGFRFTEVKLEALID